MPVCLVGDSEGQFAGDVFLHFIEGLSNKIFFVVADHPAEGEHWLGRVEFYLVLLIFKGKLRLHCLFLLHQCLLVGVHLLYNLLPNNCFLLLFRIISRDVFLHKREGLPEFGHDAEGFFLLGKFGSDVVVNDGIERGQFLRVVEGPVEDALVEILPHWIEGVLHFDLLISVFVE